MTAMDTKLLLKMSVAMVLAAVLCVIVWCGDEEKEKIKGVESVATGYYGEYLSTDNEMKITLKKDGAYVLEWTPTGVKNNSFKRLWTSYGTFEVDDGKPDVIYFAHSESARVGSDKRKKIKPPLINSRRIIKLHDGKYKIISKIEQTDGRTITTEYYQARSRHTTDN